MGKGGGATVGSGCVEVSLSASAGAGWVLVGWNALKGCSSTFGSVADSPVLGTDGFHLSLPCWGLLSRSNLLERSSSLCFLFLVFLVLESCQG